MALAQIINGTREEIIRYLEHSQGKQNLTLIIPETESHDKTPKPSFSLPENTQYFHGIPLLPVLESGVEMTLERVKELQNEDNNLLPKTPVPYLEGGEIFHGIQILPIREDAEVMTLERVKELLGEDY